MSDIGGVATAPDGASSRLGRVLALPLCDQLNFAWLRYYRAKGWLLYRGIFASYGRGSAIYPPTLIGGARFIHIGERVIIRKGVRLEAVLLDPDRPPEIRIGYDVIIEQDAHIVTTGRILIGDRAGLGPRATILGASHPFFDVHSPVKIAGRFGGAGSSTEIGAGSLLGAGSVVQMNAKIGKHVVVGSGAVVRGRVPDYCVVEGNPAAVVLRHDAEHDRWQPPETKGRGR